MSTSANFCACIGKTDSATTIINKNFFIIVSYYVNTSSLMRKLENGLKVSLELLSEDKVEVAATFLTTYVGTVETVGPIDTHQTHHRQENTHTKTR